MVQNKKRKAISVRLPEKLLGELREYVKKEGGGITEVIERGIIEQIKRIILP